MQSSAEPGHPVGLFPVPGDGVLARRGNLILLCSLNVSQLADHLLDLLEQAADEGDDGRRFTDAVAGAVESAEAADGHSVLAFGPAGAGVAVTVSGGAWADVTTADGTARVEAGHPGMLLRCVLRSPVTGVRGGLSPSDNGAASTDRFSRLDAGTMRAGGLSFYLVSPSGPHGPGSPASPVSPVGAAPPQAAAEPAGSVGEPSGLSGFAAGPAEAGPVQFGKPSAPAEEAWPGEEGAPAGEAGPAQPPGGPEPVLEPTAAWVPEDFSAPVASPSAADLSERQATELWTPPPGPGPQEGAGNLEQELTAPPEPFAARPFAAEPFAAQPGAAQPEPAHEPYSSGQPFDAVLLGAAPDGADSEVRQPLAKVRDLPPGTSSYVSAGPVVQGVYCTNGHFDDPEARYCAVCGISMNQQTLVPRPGERPPLGVLLLDDGSVFQLDSDYVVGREPSLDASVAAGHARPLRVSDESGIVSRVHARIALDGWHVLVTDLGSANGTRVLLSGQPADQQLVPQVPIVLTPGSQIDLGGRGFRYESHRGR